MDYDPFVRGEHPVGVRSAEVGDPARAHRRLPVEVWYPALPRYGGLDLHPATQDAFAPLPGAPDLRQAAVRGAAPAPGRRPLVLFSHTSHGHRRQSTFLCTHLASHGYVVAAADHVGNAFADAVARAALPPRAPAERDAYVRRIVADRVPDLRALLEGVLDGAVGGAAEQLDGDRVGVVGWSFGGWAALAAVEADARFGAAVALAPAGSSAPLPGIVPATLAFARRRVVPTLLLAAERDRATPLPGIAEIFARTPPPKAMLVLRHADHDHFGDHVEVELCPRAHARLFARGLALAHFDAALAGHDGARRFLAGDPAGALRERGVEALAHPAA